MVEGLSATVFAILMFALLAFLVIAFLCDFLGKQENDTVFRPRSPYDGNPLKSNDFQPDGTGGWTNLQLRRRNGLE
ncbi:hypothetical protein A3H22_01430 [Candidatus Peribacteria bacterium RIFCSPLOWO2_12_FULL_55_15]|nr:MAG: hypothetical protein A2789_01630 [Candidatus Peribacteria bacterium RIFCSPHIGHO2_01_FULL_54_22]OGJ62474.1 MAG: hypothetical protein A3D12_04420 [Candidatus Peribacteria bacterium RIFCSPHIGHO2_02_FULL_55_24]OGJ64901.1 MAG: hypothetical protein A3E47_01605 [Candidatus Peribacteria bacterium RIFCSPHIGHO2_12_FULL_54_10]OGJ67523.1 MAG: hypothetical protein A2947_02380 [Candidatus Peribacteria bacterium RIFCSPLOWO2_01_FULL_54_110]OGJ69278.1 MAG: hypothetical protein A3H90_02100 [Candidatus Pe